jgi:short-subunit dehydrogenase
MQSIRGKVIVITGASSGIGRVTAHRLADEGAKLVLAARGEESLLEAARECEERGAEVLAVTADTTDRKAVDALKTRALEAFGHIDVWVNGAAVGLFGKFDSAPEEAFRQVVETDFFGYVNCARAVFPHFKERREGTLINIASIDAAIPQPYTSAYVASKAAVRALGESLRMELKLDHFDKINVCTVMPASIDTPLFAHAANYAGREVRAMDPVQAPEQVAAVIAGLIRRPRREVMIGGTSRMFALERRVAAGLFERMFARFVDRSHMAPKPAGPTEGNLFRPMPELDSERGGWREPSSDKVRLTRVGIGVAAGAAVAVVAGAAWLITSRRKLAHAKA